MVLSDGRSAHWLQDEIRNLKFAAPVKLRLYHGTAYSNLPSIMEHGLVGNYSKAVNREAIFLTAHFETAARYATGVFGDTSTPCVIELVLSVWSRRNRIEYDPWDRAGNFGGDFEQHVFEELDKSLTSVLSLSVERLKEQGIIPEELDVDYFWIHKVVNWFLPGFNNITRIRRFNIYSQLARDFAFSLEVDKKAVRKVLREIFSEDPELADGFIEVAEDGSLQLTEDFWLEVEQIALFQTKLPPKAFQGVWLRFSDFDISPDDPRILDTVKAGARFLPQEEEEIYEKILTSANVALVDLDRALAGGKPRIPVPLTESNNMEALLDLLKVASSFEEDYKLLVEAVSKFDETLSKFFSDEELADGWIGDFLNSEKLEKSSRDLLWDLLADVVKAVDSIRRGITESSAYGDPVYKSQDVFFKVSPKDALALRSKLKKK